MARHASSSPVRAKAGNGDALVAEFSASGTMLRSYIHGESLSGLPRSQANAASGDDPIVWFELASMTSAGLRHLLSDERGSIVGVTDGRGSSSSGGRTRHETGNTTMVNSEACPREGGERVWHPGIDQSGPVWL